jgi:hypothetical protein
MLSKEPIAAASTIYKPTKKTKSFNPGLDIPKKPSKVVKDKAKALLEIVDLESSDDQKDNEPSKVTELITALLKNKSGIKDKRKNNKRNYSNYFLLLLRCTVVLLGFFLRSQKEEKEILKVLFHLQ